MRENSAVGVRRRFSIVSNSPRVKTSYGAVQPSPHGFAVTVLRKGAEWSEGKLASLGLLLPFAPPVAFILSLLFATRPFRSFARPTPPCAPLEATLLRRFEPPRFLVLVSTQCRLRRTCPRLTIPFPPIALFFSRDATARATVPFYVS